MKARYGLTLGVMVFLLGCGDSTSTSTTLSPEQLAGMSQVVLKVPNMT